MIRALFLAVVAVALVAPARAQDIGPNEPAISTDRNDFDGYTSYTLVNNIIRNPAGTDGRLELNLMLIVPDDDEAHGSLFVVYEASDWLFIEEGESLVFLIDGERHALSGEGSNRHQRVRTGGGIRESASYTYPPGFVLNLIQAEDVRLSVRGQRGRVEGRMLEHNRETMARFVLYTMEQRGE